MDAFTVSAWRQKWISVTSWIKLTNSSSKMATCTQHFWIRRWKGANIPIFPFVHTLVGHWMKYVSNHTIKRLKQWRNKTLLKRWNIGRWDLYFFSQHGEILQLFFDTLLSSSYLNKYNTLILEPGKVRCPHMCFLNVLTILLLTNSCPAACPHLKRDWFLTLDT